MDWKPTLETKSTWSASQSGNSTSSSVDNGYDATDLRQRLRRRGIRPQMPKPVWKPHKPRGLPIKKAIPRFQAERVCAWFQRHYRRLAVRWERLAICFNAFLAIAVMHIWTQR